MTKENRLRSRFEYLASTFGVVLFAFYWGVIGTFPEFYFVNPFLEEPSRAAALVLLIIGWVSISTFVPIVLSSPSRLICFSAQSRFFSVCLAE